MRKFSLAIFDLDGVLVDTARYHYQAWNRLTETMFSFHLSQRDYERFKGVSRMACMDIVEELSGQQLSAEEKAACAAQKNRWYLESIRNLSRQDLLAGSLELLQALKEHGVRIALGSASRNAKPVLDALEIRSYFDYIVDGTLVSRAKPDPEVFARASQGLQIPAAECIVFEDAYAGVEAAHAGGMAAFGIGSWKDLANADFVAPDLKHVPMEILFG